MSISGELLVPDGISPFFGYAGSCGDKQVPFSPDSAVASGPSACVGDAAQPKAQQADRVVRQSYLNRILEINEDLREDGTALCLHSQRDFWSFARSVTNLRRGGLATSVDGILRAIWDNENNDYVGLDFHGNQLVSYAFFKDTGQVRLDRTSGSARCSEVMGQIEIFGLAYLLRQ